MTTATAPTSSPAETESPLSLLFADLDGELATTRRMLERVPDGKDDWRPHEKSMTLGQLATHVAQLPGFGILMLTEEETDGSGGPRKANVTDNASRLKLFDEVSREFKGHLQRMTWDHAQSHWTLKVRGDTVLKAPRANLVRSMVITHSAHHRAQLGVYLRLLDHSVPTSYGPTADEGLPPA